MENKFKGTKGKWVFDSQSMKIKGTGDIEGMTVIADVSPNIDYSRGMTTQSFNAKLISKAPEMLEAMQWFLENVRCREGVTGKTYNRFKKLVKEATEV